VFLDRFCLEWSDFQDTYYFRGAGDKQSKTRTGQRWHVTGISGGSYGNYGIKNYMAQQRNNKLLKDIATFIET
jgi:hypothetical protein